MQLNKAQKQVVKHASGPLLVVAGAGTGKTRVIVERINRLLEDGVEPRRILALTFTEKAAAEMLDRVLQSRGGFELTMPVMTFNAYGESILRHYTTDIGLSRDFLLLGESAKIVFLKQHLTELELDYYAPPTNPEASLPDVADYFSRLKQHVITPEAYEEFARTMTAGDEAEQLEKQKHQELARAYGNYVRICKEQNVIDYDDQIYRVIELLNVRPNVKKELQSLYAYIMVDEFQDTNPMQSRMIDLLAGTKQNIMVVGDDDQSIYGFRGATLANILDFKKRYPKAQEITLRENYRSAQAILDASYQLIQYNNPHRLEAQLGIHKQLQAQSIGKKPLLKQFATLDQELAWIAKDIKARLEQGAGPADIAILCRRNTTATHVSQALQLGDIEHIVIGQKYQLYKTNIVRMLVEALRAIVDPSADTSLYHTLCGAVFNIPGSTLATYAASAKKSHTALEAYLLGQPEITKTDVSTAIEHIQAWRESAATLSVGQLLYKVIEESGYKDRLYRAALDGTDAALSITQLSQFFRTLKEFESIATQPTALQYLESFPVLEAAGETDEDSTLDLSDSKVNILTIHKAKGLEWPVVYIPDCSEGSFPLRARSGGITIPDELLANIRSEADEHLAEERRLMYVALTRAKHELLISYSTKHHTPTPRKPSRFVNELFGDVPAVPLASNEVVVPTISFVGQSSNTTTTVPLPATMLQNGLPRLSVSQIVTFLNCPLDFYYRFVLGVPEPDSAAATYGLTLHTAIETFNTRRMNDQPVLLDELQAVLEQAWHSTGFLDKRQAEKAKEQAQRTVQTFYERHVGGAAPTKVEWPFSTVLKAENIIVAGRLDAVFETDNGVEIRDYKTSAAVNTQEKAKQRASASHQLTLYALIWQELYGELPAKLSLEFVNTGLVGEIRKTQRGVDTMRGKLSQVAASIQTNSYPAGTDHRYCHHPSLD